MTALAQFNQIAQQHAYGVEWQAESSGPPHALRWTVKCIGAYSCIEKMQDKNSHVFLSEWRGTRPRERSEPEDGEGGSCHSRCWCFGVEPSRCLTMIDRSIDSLVG